MKHATLRTAVVAAVAVASCAPAYAADCHQVAGRHVETVVVPFASPNDPLGRVVGQADGTISGVATAILTSVTPGPGGPPAWNATTRHVFVVNAQDQIAATGTAQFTPIPGNFTDVNDTVTLTVNGAQSTGRFAGATGTITLKGIGYNFYAPFPFPGPAAGSASFVFQYQGTVCFADAANTDK